MKNTVANLDFGSIFSKIEGVFNTVKNVVMVPVDFIINLFC